MNKKISTQIKDMLFRYTVLLVGLFLIAVTSLTVYTRLSEMQDSTRAIVNIIANDLNRIYFTKESDQLVIDENYTIEENFLIDIMAEFDKVTTIYIYEPLNADEKIYLMNIERTEDGTPYNVKEFINMKEEFSPDYNHNERVCYLTGKLEEDTDISFFTKYGSTITAIAPVYDNNHKIIAFVGLDCDITDFVNLMMQIVCVLFLIFAVIGFFMSKWGLHIINKRIVVPIQDVEMAAIAFATSEHNGNSAQFKLPEVENSENELHNLAKSMNTMMQDIDDYITNIAAITAEKERIGVELDVATKIQGSYLPRIFPAYPERNDFDLYATMDPAKEVGGDFYDYFMIDNDHIGLVVADVSGKGIPAALFMMIGKTLIKNQSANTKSPAEIMRIVNNQLCENNEAEMFITIWLGIVELSTGKVTACNAGHKSPTIQRANGLFENFKDKHGIMVGTMPNFKYKEYEFQLNPGDCLFNCTDGVMEATNAHEELFETERMLKALNKNPNGDVKDILRNVRTSIDEFVGDAPQFDDITMLCFRYYGPEGKKNN